MNIDVFPFFNEVELLKIRLAELWDVVDRFIAVEASETFSGRAKQYYMHENWHHFTPWHSKLSVFRYDKHVESKDPWIREKAQRDFSKHVFRPSDDDVITYSDCDEIPHPSVYRRFNHGDGVNALDMMFFAYYLNARRYIRWRYGKVVSGLFWNSVDSIHSLRFWTLRSAGDDWGIYSKLMPFGGWHFAWMGGYSKIKYKITASSHCNDREAGVFDRAVDKAGGPPNVCPGGSAVPVKVDARWPKTIVSNQDKYIRMGWMIPC